MPTEPLTPPEVPIVPGPYAAAVLATGTRLLAISGQLAVDSDGELVGQGDAEEQARQCLRNVDTLLRTAGAEKEDIVSITVLLTSMGDRPAVARAREEYFGDHRPAATLFEVAALVRPEFKVEIEATALF